MRNLYKPNRYNVASIQAQQTMGGDVMQADENGQYVEWRDYKWLLDSMLSQRPTEDLEAENARLTQKLRMERIHDLNQIGGLQEENASLKDEVESLKEGNEYLGQMHDKEMERSAYLLEEFNRLKAEVKRLTNLKSGADYFKAKEGEQS